MITRNIGLSLFLIGVLASCSSEKVTLSPLYDSFPTGNVLVSNAPDRDFKSKKEEIYHASELVNYIASIPTFSSAPVNDEINDLTVYIRNHIYALESFDENSKRQSVEKIEKSYRKIQKLRKALSEDEDEVLNRYLVKIKSGIASLNNPANSSGI